MIDDLERMDKLAALARLKDHHDGLNELRNNPEVENHAAEDYIVESLDLLEAAIFDIGEGFPDIKSDYERRLG